MFADLAVSLLSSSMSSTLYSFLSSEILFIRWATHYYCT